MIPRTGGGHAVAEDAQYFYLGRSGFLFRIAKNIL
jgi:hypothetical protein